VKQLECDVVVVGCGAAGLTAALSALELGASVIVLERAPEAMRGGNTRWTEALMRLKPDGQISDDFVEAFTANSGYHLVPEFVRESSLDYENWSQIVKTLPFLDPDVLDAFTSNVPATLAWLSSHGVKFKSANYPFALDWPFYGVYGGGLALIETLCPQIEKAGGQIMYETTFTGLLQDEDDRVVGVKALTLTHEVLRIFAKKTVLACGGFEGNQSMLTQYLGLQGRFMRPVAAGGWYNKGDGIRLALGIGAAAAGDYAECHRQLIDPRSSASEPLVNAYPHGIVVNQQGKRFMDEAPDDLSLYLEDPCRLVNAQSNGLAYFIYDAQMEEIPMWRKMLRTDQPPFEAASIAALAEKIGVPADTLTATIATFNAGCRPGAYRHSAPDGNRTVGVEPPKSNWARRIDTPAFGAYPLIASVTFTYGGLKVTRNAEVVHGSGMRIPGLYAAGETMGIFYGLYTAATSVLRGLVFGRIAGRHSLS